MKKSHIRHISLWKWFRPNDPIATSVARLCILKEDLLLELNALTPDAIPQLDGNGPEWRRIYFFRRSVRTLTEIRGAIETLRRQGSFKHSFKSQPKSIQDQFNDLFKEMTESHELLKTLSNCVGGHVLNRAVQEALNNMELDRVGLIEIGRKGGDIHFRFVGELIMAILLAGVPNKDQKTILEGLLQRMGNLVPVLRIIDLILTIYSEERGLART